MKNILGKKHGMTRVFSEEGIVEPVSVLEAGPCVVTQIKTEQKNGYQAIQIGYLAATKLNAPGRVFKGTPMAGHMGSQTITTSNLKVVRVDTERNLILVKGSVPGSKNTILSIKESKKGNKLS